MRNIRYNTKLKQSILDYLKKNSNESISAKDIYKYLVSTDEQVNLSTVYRNLEKLTEDNVILKYVSNDGKTSGYIWNSKKACHEHLHLQCINCGKIIHLDCGCSEEFIERIETKHDFELKCDNTVLYGICGECKKNKVEKIR